MQQQSFNVERKEERVENDKEYIKYIYFIYAKLNVLFEISK